MWKYISKSQIGTSHVQAGSPCQDSIAIKEIELHGKSFLVFACADGAGSASRSDIGAINACGEFISIATDFIRSAKCDLEKLSRDEIHLWVKSIKATICEVADAEKIPLRQFACTLLAGILSNDSSVFLQIGDGGIVVDESTDELSVVFWPQSGEYVNTTYFITDEDAEDHVEFGSRGSVNKLAVFTDGLERLLLRFDDRAAHKPALDPMFSQLISTEPQLVAQLEESLGRFLDSPQINSRTDDDKSLILAVRICDESVL